MIGRTVSHYRITEEIDGGSMGVVYRAEDFRLKHFITIKLPSEKYTADALRLDRFKREARTESSLNYSNFCATHDADEFEDRPYIAMESVGGVTLRELAAAEPVELDHFFEPGLQMALAVDVPEFTFLAEELHEQVATVQLSSDCSSVPMNWGTSKGEMEDSSLFKDPLQAADYLRRTDALKTPDQ